MPRDTIDGKHIPPEHTVIRPTLNLETVATYKGPYDIHTMIVGREITGFGALE